MGEIEAGGERLPVQKRTRHHEEKKKPKALQGDSDGEKKGWPCSTRAGKKADMKRALRAIMSGYKKREKKSLSHKSFELNTQKKKY